MTILSDIDETMKPQNVISWLTWEHKSEWLSLFPFGNYEPTITIDKWN